MTPPVLYELLRDLDQFIFETIGLIEDDPDEWYRQMERFACYLVCKAYIAGARNMLKALTPSPN